MALNLVLNKSALSGLRVLFWHEPSAAFLDGTIQMYDIEQDAFIIGPTEPDAAQHAVQFHQFVVEEDGGQLLLKVTKCTLATVPDRFRVIMSPQQSLHSSAGTSGRASDTGGAQQPPDSMQLSAELSQQLSGLVGQSFSQTDEGFQALPPERSAPIALPAAAQGQQQRPGQGDSVSEELPSGEDNDGAGSFWGSPVKASGSALLAAAVAAGSSTDSASLQLPGSEAGTSAAAGHASSCRSSTSSASDAPLCLPAAPGGAEPLFAVPQAAAAASCKPSSLSSSSCFTSFQEISRMISQTEDAATGGSRRASRSSQHQPASGVAMRLLEEPLVSSWGTPGEGSSPWGSPSERRSAAAAGAAAAAEQEQDEEPMDASLPSFSVHLAAAAAAAAGEEPLEGLLPEGAGEVPASERASDPGQDFAIPVGVADAPPRPASRTGSLRGSSLRGRLQDAMPLEATDEGMMVDIPQPLSSRRVSRTSARHLFLTPSDPGFGAAAAAAAAGASISTGGGGELRRTVSNMSAPASRRISRNTSSRLNADQDWAVVGSDGQQQALLQHMQQQQHSHPSMFAAAAATGQAAAPLLHIPGPSSRRASRTLSGRLLDQDGLSVELLDRLDDAEPDVLARPVTATSLALDTIVSRHQSNSGRDTPDSDELGFGFSEVGGEPLVPPELAQHAALAEAAQQTAMTQQQQLAEAPPASAAGAALGHSRSHRRSHRSIPAPAAAPQQRVSMRLSDQDEQHYEAVAAGGLGHSSDHPALPHSISGSRLTEQVIQEGHSFNPEQEQPSPCQQQQQQPAEQPAQAFKQPRWQIEQQPEQPLEVSLQARLQASEPCSPSAVDTAEAAAAAGTSPPETAPAAGSRSASSEADRRSGSAGRRSVSGILQAAAAAAAVAEAAAAAAFGFALGGRGTPAEQQALEAAAAAAEAEAAAETPEAAAGGAAGMRLAGDDEAAAQPEFASFVAGIGEKASRQLMQDSFVASDSFSCPPFMLGSGGSTAKSNPFADPCLFSFSQLNSSSSSISAFIGTMPMAEAALDAAQQAAAAGPGSPGSPNAAMAALLRKQQLLPLAASVDGSEWGSGALLGTHLTAGIDSPTGSAVFKTNPFDAADSGDLHGLEPSSSLSALAGATLAGKGGPLGASRMAREAAAVLPFASLAAPAAAAAHTQSNIRVKHGSGLTEITPVDDAGNDSDGERIGSYYRSGGGSGGGAGPLISSSSTAGRAAGGTGDDSAGLPPGAADTLHQEQAAAGPAAVSLNASRSKDSSSDEGSGSAAGVAPPSYAESVGAEADDERSPSSAAAASRRVWPAAAAAAAAGDSSSDGCSSQGGVRHGAELLSRAASGAIGQQVLPGSPQLDASGRPAEPAVTPGVATGLVKRNVSRTPSQVLAATDGIVLLSGGGGYCYEDEAIQPLVAQQQQLQQQAKGAVPAAGQVPRTLQEARAQVGRVALDALLANSAHFFDSLAFVVLGGQLMAAAMAPPRWSQQQQLGALFALFAAGHVLWLLGCLLWPAVAGRQGRRAVLTWTVCLSAFPTALLGCMPSFAEGGFAGLAVLAALRFLSGLGLGTEGPAALVYLTEHAPQFPCLHASLVPCAMAAGALGASGVALFFSLVLSAARLGVLGWRLVLVASLLVNGLAVLLRGCVQDPEAHMSAAELTDRRNGHLWKVLRQHPGPLLACFGLQAFAAAGLFLLTAWMPVYLSQLTALPTPAALAVHTVNCALLTASIPLGGFLADKYGRTSLLLSTLAAAVAFGYPAWLLFEMSVPVLSWFCQLMLALFVGLHWGGLASALVECFPKGVRASALTLALVLPMTLLGSTAPLMALGFVIRTGSLASPAFVTIITAVVSGAAVLATQLRSGV